MRKLSVFLTSKCKINYSYKPIISILKTIQRLYFFNLIFKHYLKKLPVTFLSPILPCLVYLSKLLETGFDHVSRDEKDTRSKNLNLVISIRKKKVRGLVAIQVLESWPGVFRFFPVFNNNIA